MPLRTVGTLHADRGSGAHQGTLRFPKACFLGCRDISPTRESQTNNMQSEMNTGNLQGFRGVGVLKQRVPFKGLTKLGIIAYSVAET